MTKIISIVGGLQPSTPTIGTASDGGTGTSANVAFTPSTYIGKGTITYTATSSPGGFTGTSATSPISVTGLTTGTAYTFTVTGTTNYGVTSIASGSSNSVTPASPDSGVYYPISSIIVGSAGATSITFSSIPSTYTHLQIRATMVNASTNYSIKIRFNGDTSTNYSAHQITGTGSAVLAGAETSVDIALIGVGANNTSLYSAGMITDILDYANTNKYKTVRSFSGGDGNGSGQIKLVSAGWRSTSAITSIFINADGSTFNQYTSFALYGIKGA